MIHLNEYRRFITFQIVIDSSWFYDGYKLFGFRCYYEFDWFDSFDDFAADFVDEFVADFVGDFNLNAIIFDLLPPSNFTIAAITITAITAITDVDDVDAIAAIAAIVAAIAKDWCYYWYIWISQLWMEANSLYLNGN